MAIFLISGVGQPAPRDVVDNVGWVCICKLDDPAAAGSRSKRRRVASIPGENALWPHTARAPTGCGVGARKEFERLDLVGFTLICLDWVELRLFPAAAGCHPCQPPKSPNATRTRGNWFRSRAPICLWGASFINLWPDLPGFTRINLRVPAGRDLGDGTTGGALPFLPFRCPPPTPNSLPSRPTSGAFSLLPGGLGFPAALISPRQPAQRSERTTHPCFHFSISAFQYFSFLFEWMCRPVVVLPRGGSPNSKGAALLNAARAVAAATINLSPAPL